MCEHWSLFLDYVKIWNKKAYFLYILKWIAVYYVQQSHFEITIFIYKSKPLHTKMLCGNISTTLFIVDCKSLSKTTSYSFYGLWASFFWFFYSFTCWDFKTGKNVLGMLTTNQMNDFTSPRPTFHNRYIVTL